MTAKTATAAGYRFALNPIQWMATDDGWLDPGLAPAPRALLKAVREAGYEAIHAQIPAGWSVDDYRAALEEAGLKPAPGYFPVGFPEHGISAEAAVEAARVMAADFARLGLSEMFLGPKMSAVRLARPAIGAPDEAVSLEAAIALFDRISAAVLAEGIYGAFHPHIAAIGETEAEARQFLDNIPARQMGFGPDTGHLAWAQADFIGMVSAYRDRTPVVHVKDCLLSVRDRAQAAGLDYKATVRSGMWAEPGLGELDLVAMIHALGPDFAGWLIAEVDRPGMPPAESARVSAAWLGALKRPQ